MAITVKHSKVSAIPDGDDTSVVRPSDWNADHTLVGTVPVANGGTGASTAADGLNNLLPSQTGNNGKVLATDGTNATWTTNGSGDVVGPSSATDNAVARFDTTTGKLIQNSVTTIDDTGNASGILSQQFSNGSAVTLAAGKMWYDGTTGAWNAGMGNGNITQQIGEELFIYGKASAAITDSPLQIVYHTGTVGASSVITFAPTIAGITDENAIVGVATENIALNGFGRVTTFGLVRGITTNGTAFGETWADDDVIWYNPVTGNPTKVKPSAPNIKFQIGLVVKAGAGGSGSFQVALVQGTQLGGTDSNVKLTTPANGNILTYDGGNGYWKNTDLTAGTGISVSKSANGVLTVTNSSPNTYDPTNVAITGGTINNTVIGGTTPSTGKFTTLEATGNSTFGTASANYISATGAGAGSAPYLAVAGSDTDIFFQHRTKGTGAHDFYTNNALQFRIANTTSAVNRLQITGSATGVGIQISAQGTDADIPLVLQPKGTGALQAQLTDSTATGGNARGINATDWQTSRAGASQVASGSSSVIGGGVNNTNASTLGVICGGANNTNNASSYGTLVGGNGSTLSGQYASIVGGQSHSGSGYYNFIGGGFTNSGTATGAVTTQSGTMNGTTAVTLSGSNASIKVGQLITGTSIASTTYVAAISGTALTLSQNASGSSTSTLSFFTPHGVVVGGGNNQATGSYSFIGGGGDAGTAANRNVASGDYSVVVGGQKNVASGIGSFVGGGGTSGGSPLSNTASGLASLVVGGWNNTANSTYSSILGGQSNAAINVFATVGGGQSNYANGISSTISGGSFGTTRAISGNQIFPAHNSPISSAIYGASQGALLILGRQTTDATATVLTSDTNAASTTNQVILPNNSAYYFKGEVIAGVTGGGNTKGFTIEGVIKRGANAAATTLVGSTVMSAYGDAGAATWTVALAADTTNGGLRITVTGVAATTIRWVAKVETTEMTY